MNPKDSVGAKKAPLDLVPAAGAIMSAPAHQNGMEKYGAFNWRLNPVQLMTYLAAIQRHKDAFVDGQDVAEDTGIHHFSHMLAGMNIIADAMALGNLIDNRPPKGPAADMLRAQDHSEKPVPQAVEQSIKAEQWGDGDGGVYGMSPSGWHAYGAAAYGTVSNEQLPQALPCCGQTRDHAIECPQWR